MRELRILTSTEESTLTREELIKYYNELKLYYKSQEFSKINAISREILHPLMLGGVIASRVMSGAKLEILNKDNLPNKSQRPVIFAVNHSNSHDFPTVAETVKRHFHILADFTMKDDLFVDLLNRGNGAVYVDRKSDTDSAKAKIELIKLLLNGYSILLFPEATWNLSPNKLMLPMKWGIIDISRLTGAPIVPIALEYTDEKYYVNIGKQLLFDIQSDKKESIDLLTDSIASLRWEIFEKLPILEREGLDPLYFEEYIQKCLDEYERFDLEYEQSVIFKPKGIVNPEEVFNVRVRELNRSYTDGDKKKKKN